MCILNNLGMTVSNNNKILKNTLLLYIRMFLTMGLGLLSSRYILKSLGIVDYGIYNVVGGVVTMFTFFNATMSSSVSRFLTFELGKENLIRLKKIFSTSLLTHALLAILIIILSETIGLWFLYNKLVIPSDRFYAACWVYQISIISCVIGIISVPYNSAIIAHEKMGTFAFIAIIDSILKFSISVLLCYYKGDRLVLYAILLMLVLLLDRFIYGLYCRRNFEEVRVNLLFDKKLFVSMFSFAGWNSIEHLALMGINTGLNILLNMFFGPIVNTARGIAYQMNGAISSFYSNFQMAMNPQIIKYYAQEELVKMHKLIEFGSKLSFFLVLLISLPVFVNTSYLLKLWLGTIPEYSVTFLRIIIIITLVGSLSRPLITSVQATGNIKLFQLFQGGIMLLIVPIAYIFLRLGYPPESVFIIHLLIEIVAMSIRIRIVLPMIKYPIIDYLKNVIVPILLTSLASFMFSLTSFYIFNSNDFISFVVIVLLSLFFTSISIFLLGLLKNERSMLCEKIKSICFSSAKK